MTDTFHSVDLAQLYSTNYFEKVRPRTCTHSNWLFQISYDQGIFPDGWKSARMQPVSEKGFRTLPSKYRPISLLSVICKVMSLIINWNILKYLETNKLINSFITVSPVSATVDLPLIFLHVSPITGLGGWTFTVSKATNRVWHAGHLHKLSCNGILPKLCTFQLSIQ